MKKFLFLFILGVFFFVPSLSVQAAEEFLYICGPCSRNFVPIAEDVIQELALEDNVHIKLVSCLGACTVSPVVEFKGEIYGHMTKEKLFALLRSYFTL